MHEDYEDQDYDDDDYDYDHPALNPYSYFFKFDVSSDNPISKWLNDMISNIDWYKSQNIGGFPYVSLPVNDYFSNTASGLNPLLYLGNNQYNEQVWKSKDFIVNKLKNEYLSHLQSHSSYFVQQPNFYKGLFEILN